jgi:ribosomal-protein-alanine N-acetyltransferase
VNAETAVQIVPMREEHIDELMPYEKAMFGTEAWTANGYRTELADTRNRFYVAAEFEGALVGWAGLLAVADVVEILTVGVIESARRRGIGHDLIAALLAEARRRGAVEVFLEVRVDNAAARALYAHEGFDEIAVRAGYYDAGRVDAVVMRRAL